MPKAPPSTITLAELHRCQRDASQRPPWRYQAISFTCADSSIDLHLIVQHDDGSGNRGGGRWWPWQQRVATGPLPSSSGGDPVLKAQLVTSGDGPPRRGHVPPSDRPGDCKLDDNVK
jgi:hypothetical protein